MTEDRLWVEVTCCEDTERVFITADDGPFERKTEPFEPYVPWPGDGEWHVSFNRHRHSSPPSLIPIAMMLVCVAMMLLVVFGN